MTHKENKLPRLHYLLNSFCPAQRWQRAGLQVWLDCRDPCLALLQGVLPADMLLKFIFQTAVHLRQNGAKMLELTSVCTDITILE